MNYWSLAAFAALMILAGSSGAFFQPGAWYERLAKPWWTPPNWAFGPIWTVLYVMIAVSGWLVWESGERGTALWLWGAQLVLNALWSALFFGMKRMDLAFGEVTLMWLSIAAYIVVVLPISTLAALLFVPYLLWVTTAAALNFQVWRMNTGAVPG